ncbi:hypothetical protein Dsin_023943 [Dipteronia sinensis]|uniref:F-box domain-containing protein n=1 Tax=Dipteronia sinensis TaxID=43782 RepID=A0AAE0E194_9ROSI|nr:hypothetical protein Dsin_023943 [Dipteronia sinensis]
MKKQKHNAASPSWSNLSSDILISILELLPYVDQIYFRAVCRNWRFKIYGVVKYADKLPWVLAFNPLEDSFDCVICVVFTHDKDFKFCMNTCSPENNVWNRVWFDLNGYNGHELLKSISQLGYMGGVFYFTFQSQGNMMVAFKREQHEWKTYPYPSIFFIWDNCFIESCIDGTLIIGNGKFEEEEERRGLANTIHVAHHDCSGHFYKASKTKFCPQTYNWIDKDGLKRIWIQPPQIGTRKVDRSTS